MLGLSRHMCNLWLQHVVSSQGSNLELLHWELEVLAMDHQGSPDPKHLDRKHQINEPDSWYSVLSSLQATGDFQKKQ